VLGENDGFKVGDSVGKVKDKIVGFVVEGNEEGHLLGNIVTG